MKLVPLLLLLGCQGGTPSPTEQAPGAAAELGWLVGHWQVTDGGTVTEERWVPDAKGDLLGQGRVLIGRVPGFSETLAIQQTRDGLVYVAWPGGQDPSQFSVSESSQGGITFSRQVENFPSEITYTREGDKLSVSATGLKEGQPHSERWELTLVP